MSTWILRAAVICLSTVLLACGEDPTATIDEVVLLSANASTYGPSDVVEVTLVNWTSQLLRAGHCESPNLQRLVDKDWTSMVFLCPIGPPPFDVVAPGETLTLSSRYDRQHFPAGTYRAFQTVYDEDWEVFDTVYSQEFVFVE